MVGKSLLVLASLGIFLFAGCSSAGGPGVSQGALPSAVRPAAGNPVSQYIQHVVVIIQENRTFENFFAGYPGANAPMFGYAKHGNHRVMVQLKQTTFETNTNLPHTWQSGIVGWDKGKMDGFHDAGTKPGVGAYVFVDRSQVAPYWEMAQQYVLADEMFPTEFGGSYTGHLTAVAGTDNMSATEAQVNYPTHRPNDCDSPPGTTSSLVNSKRVAGRGNGPFPCFTQFKTMASVLDSGGISWKFYATKVLNAGIWSPFEAIKYVRKGPDWDKDIIAPQTRILTDISSGNLAQVTWVTPSHPDSDHPGAHSDLGPSWVSSIVNAIGESQYWNTTAIVVIWDDSGGFFDNSPPPQLDFRGLAERVPCLIVSPYPMEASSGAPGFVSHTQYEFGSIIKFVEQVFNLPYEGSRSQERNNFYTDERANSIIDSFDFTNPPRPFVPISAKYPAARFIHEPPSDEPVDNE
jgi:phospholipase C